MKIGDVFRYLTVVEFLEDKRKILVRCVCGTSKAVQKGHLISGSTVSCGCYRRKSSSKRMIEQNTTHGMCNTPTYKSWEMMIQRCSNPNFDSYEYYGGKGITVCELWVADFTNFLNDMGVRPKGMSLDRVDPTGNYCKDNCRWVGKSVQSINKGMSSLNTSGEKGVYWHKGANKWTAAIGVDGKSKYLGLFETIEQAVFARKEAELLYYPEVFKIS